MNTLTVSSRPYLYDCGDYSNKGIWHHVELLLFSLLMKVSKEIGATVVVMLRSPQGTPWGEKII